MSPYWQSYWYQTMCNEDRNPGWKPLGAYPLHQVPNKALVTGTLADWVVPVLEDASRRNRLDLRRDPHRLL